MQALAAVSPSSRPGGGSFRRTGVEQPLCQLVEISSMGVPVVGNCAARCLFGRRDRGLTFFPEVPEGAGRAMPKHVARGSKCRIASGRRTEFVTREQPERNPPGKEGATNARSVTRLRDPQPVFARTRRRSQHSGRESARAGARPRRRRTPSRRGPDRSGGPTRRGDRRDRSRRRDRSGRHRARPALHAGPRPSAADRRVPSCVLPRPPSRT